MHLRFRYSQIVVRWIHVINTKVSLRCALVITYIPASSVLMLAWIWNKNFKALESAWKQMRWLKVLENPWKVLEFKSYKFWNFSFVDNFEVSTCMHVTSAFKQYLIPLCLLTYLISVTLQSKFWMSASRIWLFVDNFGAWKCNLGPWKSWKSAWILYFEFAANPGQVRHLVCENVC